MQTLLLVVHVLLAVGLIVLILLQHGKGADAGAAFGSGASSSVFGSRGSGSFLSRTTAVLATLFFVVSLAMAILANRQGGPGVSPAIPSQSPMSEQRDGRQSEDVPGSVDEAPTGGGGDVPSAPGQ